MIEVLVVSGAILIVWSVLANYIYKKVKHLPTGECACCAKKGKGIVEQYNRKYKK